MNGPEWIAVDRHGTPASATLPVATIAPSAVTAPSTLKSDPSLPATCARASSQAPGRAAAGNLNGPIAATRSCTGPSARPRQQAQRRDHRLAPPSRRG